MNTDSPKFGYQALAPARNRAAEVSERIAADIRGGRFAAGTRLPGEHELALSFGVSRTVVREAVAALRAEGLIVSRQGAGLFTAPDSARVPFRIAPDRMSVMDIIHVMELRLATEVESAALAAERGTPEHLAALKTALEAIDLAIARGSSAVQEDFAFHLAVASASRNPMFEGFLTFLGNHVIPRQNAQAARIGPDEREPYLMRIQQEHRSIVTAIAGRDPVEARLAMRRHLSSSLARQRTFLSDMAAAQAANCAVTL